MTVALTIAPFANSRSSASRLKLVARVQLPTYGAGGHCACIPTRRSITADGERLFRSRRSWRASVARFSSRSVRTRSPLAEVTPVRHDDERSAGHRSRVMQDHACGQYVNVPVNGMGLTVSEAAMARSGAVCDS